MTLESELVKTMLYLERYHGDSAEIIQENLLTAQKNILNYIANETNQAKIKKYINDQMATAFEDVDEEVMKDVEHIQGTTWDAMGATMAKGFVVADLADSFKSYKDVSEDVKTRLRNEAKLVQGHTLKDHFKHLSTTNARKLNGFIVDGNAKGLGTQEISRNIRNSIGNVNRNQVSTLVRTTLLEAIEEAKNESLDFFDDVIIGWRYSAVMDTRTSKVCFINNNVRHKKKSDFKVLPKNHYQCRSMLVPITELSEELDKENDKRVVQWDGKKVNHRDGTKSTKFKVGEVKQVSRNANAETYFKAFDKEYQIKYMGVKRYNLWKEGKMSFEEAFNASRKSKLPIDAVKKEVLKKSAIPEIKFGYDGRFDGYVADIRDEAKIVIDKLPKPNTIIKDSEKSYYVGFNKELHFKDTQRAFLHEYGHHIDQELGKSIGFESSPDGFNVYSEISSSKYFMDAFKKDKSFIRKEKLFDVFEKEFKTFVDTDGKIKTIDKYGGISDIIDAITNGKAKENGMLGHGSAYWERGYEEALKETFANLFEAYSRGGEIWKIRKKYLPNLTDLFESMMSDNNLKRTINEYI